MKVKIFFLTILFFTINLHCSIWLRIYLMTLDKKEKVTVKTKQKNMFKGTLIKARKKMIDIENQNGEIIGINISDIKDFEVDKDDKNKKKKMFMELTLRF